MTAWLEESPWERPRPPSPNSCPLPHALSPYVKDWGPLTIQDGPCHVGGCLTEGPGATPTTPAVAHPLCAGIISLLMQLHCIALGSGEPYLSVVLVRPLSCLHVKLSLPLPLFAAHFYLVVSHLPFLSCIYSLSIRYVQRHESSAQGLVPALKELTVSREDSRPFHRHSRCSKRLWNPREPGVAAVGDSWVGGLHPRQGRLLREDNFQIQSWQMSWSHPGKVGRDVGMECGSQSGNSMCKGQEARQNVTCLL